MRRILLNFTKPEYVDGLLADADFMAQAKYLNPVKIGAMRLGFNDPVKEHSELNTEEVVLAICGIALKRLFFRASIHPIEYITPYVGIRKIGIHIQGIRIIDSTEVLH